MEEKSLGGGLASHIQPALLERGVDCGKPAVALWRLKSRQSMQTTKIMLPCAYGHTETGLGHVCDVP